MWPLLRDLIQDSCPLGLPEIFAIAHMVFCEKCGLGLLGYGGRLLDSGLGVSEQQRWMVAPRCLLYGLAELYSKYIVSIVEVT